MGFSALKIILVDCVCLVFYFFIFMTTSSQNDKKKLWRYVFTAVFNKFEKKLVAKCSRINLTVDLVFLMNLV